MALTVTAPNFGNIGGTTTATPKPISGSGTATPYYQVGGVQAPNIAGTFSTTRPTGVLGASTTVDNSLAPSGGVGDPGTISAYNQAIANTQSAINRLPGQLNSGLSGINSSYQDALNQLLLGKNQANSAYTTNKQQTSKDYIGAKNTIGAQAGSTLSGLLRLLGSRGAGGSSAYNIAAPDAVAQGATQQRVDVGNTFGANNQALDTNWNNYLTGYNNQVTSAGSQKDQQAQTIRQSIDSNRANLLQSIATLAAQKDQAAGGSGVGPAQPYLDQANNILDSLSNYTVNPINYQTNAYTAPSLASYLTTPQTPTYQGQGQTNDYYSPYLAALLGKKQPGTA